MKTVKKVLSCIWGMISHENQPKTAISEEMTSTIIEISAIDRLGTFAKHNIQKGDLIRVMSGDRMNFAQIMRKIKRGFITPDDPLQIDKDLFIILDHPSLSINHSCNPNAGIRAQDELIAIRNIMTGEEITYDYSTSVSSSVESSDWRMSCKCNSENCRVSIGNVLTVPKHLLMKYLHLNVLQSYIIEELSDYLNNDRKA